MVSLLKEEYFKLFHKKSVRWAPVILFLIMFIIGLMVSKTLDVEFYISSHFGGTQFGLIILLVICSGIISMEFENGAIKNLVTRYHNYGLIYISKFIVMLSCSLVFYLLALVYTIIIKFILYSSQYPFSSKYINNISLLDYLVIGTFVDILASLLVIGLVILIASSSHSGSLAMAISITFCFVGQGVSNMLLRNSSGVGQSILRWNPFNMLNLMSEWSNPGYFKVTHLQVSELIVGNLAYSFLFIFLGYIIFKKHKI